MQLEIFCLCQDAPLNNIGLPCVVGIFDTSWTAGEPAVIDSLFVALGLRIYKSDEGQHRIQVGVEDESGKSLIQPITDIISFSQMTKDSTLFFQSYQIPPQGWRFGNYLFYLEIDGSKIARTPLYIARNKA